MPISQLLPTRPSLVISIGVVLGLYINAATQCQGDENVPQPEGIDIERIEQLVEALGSASFAKRERASNALMAQGSRVAESIQQILERVSDPEVIDRGQQIVEALVGEDNLKQVEAFLRGENVDFNGWRTFRNLMGDHLSVRELFIDVREVQPDLVKLLEKGTPREISVVTTKMVDASNKKLFSQMQMPSRGEIVALFLPVMNPQVPISTSHERLLFRLLNQAGTSTMRNHAQLKTPFSNLVEKFLSRSHKDNRFDALLHGIQWNLESTKDIAIEALKDTVNASDEKERAASLEFIAIAMHAITKFGTEDDATVLESYLEDSRQATEVAFRNNRAYYIQVADVAMASIAILYKISLDEIGYTETVQTSAGLFHPSELGFPVDEPQLRKQNREKLMRLVNAIRASKQQPDHSTP